MDIAAKNKKRQKKFKSEIPQKPWWKGVLSCWELYIFLLPAIILTIVFHYVPMYGIQLAFKDFIPGKTIFESDWVGLKHFIRFFSIPDFKILVWNTVKVALMSSILLFPCPVILALMLNQVRREKWKKLAQNVTYLPHLFSVVVVISITNVFLAPDTGVVNILLEKLGLEQIMFFGHEKYVLPIYGVTAVWQGTGYSAILYLAALAGIDQEQLEAAKIDGASRLRIVRHIEIPAILPTIVIVLILNWGRMFSVGADKMLLLQTPLNLDSSEILSTYVYKVGLLGGQFSFSTAVSLFNTVVNLICLIIVNTVANKVTDSSVF